MSDRGSENVRERLANARVTVRRGGFGWRGDLRLLLDATGETAIYLNDKYFLEGRDPNGYAGSPGRFWGSLTGRGGERAVFGKRRYMSGASTGKKFDSKGYIRQMWALPEAR